MDFDASSPIWLQLVTEFSRRIVTGEWPQGEKIPGVRELALQLGVNPNTVQRALGELERDGLCRAERTTGRFVTEDSERVRALARALVTDAADDYIRLSRGLRLELGEATGLVNERWNNDDLADHHRARTRG